MRAPHRYDRIVSDQEFVARVRRHTPSSLVPLIAAHAAKETEPERWLHKHGTPPWVYAEIARVSLIFGTEKHRSSATVDDLDACIAACRGLGDPELHRGEPNGLRNFMLRTAGQQLAYQQIVFNDLARTGAIFGQTQPKASHNPTTLVAGWDQQLLGCTTMEYVGAAFLLHVGAIKNAGMFDVGWLDQVQFKEITDVVSASKLRAVMSTQFVANVGLLRQAQSDAEARAGKPDADYRQYGFNPLTTFPAVSELTSTWHIPVPALLIRKASPLGIYYAGMAEYGSGFANDVGELFESYIGNQLSNISGAQVLPEVVYGPKRSRMLSVDWFVVFDECVVLIEVKSTRPTEPIRLGSPQAGDEFQRILSKGVGQLQKSAERIADRDPDFSEIPGDRPVIGLLVTMEPFHTVNSPLVSLLSADISIPWLVCSSEEVESLACVDDAAVGQLLLNHLTDPNSPGYSLKSMLVNEKLSQNSILKKAWESYPWFTNRNKEA